MPNHLDVVEDRQFLTAINTRRMYATGRNWPFAVISVAEHLTKSIAAFWREAKYHFLDLAIAANGQI